METHTNILSMLFKSAEETTYTPYNINKEYKKFLENKARELEENQKKIPSQIKSLKREISKL